MSPWHAYLSSLPEMTTDHAALADVDPEADDALEAYAAAQRPTGRLTAATVAPRTPGARTYIGARVVDRKAGVTYEVAAERDPNGQPRIVALTVLPHDGHRLTSRDPLPVSRLAKIALQQAEQHHFRTSETPSRPEPFPIVRPRLHTIASAYREVLANGGSPRQAIAAQWDVPVRTADGWIRAARRHGHLTDKDKAKPGRPASKRRTSARSESST